MRVIVNVSGFYGGTWFEAAKEPQTMPDAVAKQFLPPYGDQLSRVKSDKSDKAQVPAAKPEDKKAG